MSLTLIATPIGRLTDITEYAIENLKNCDLLIAEERRVASTILKKLNLPQKPIEELNEHSQMKDLNYLLSLCIEQNIALISDCGTPGFCDPGADLVALCRKNNISVKAAPGVASLTTFMMLSGVRWQNFYCVGFLPRETQERDLAIQKLPDKIPLIIMDTPYRLHKTLTDLEKRWAKRMAIIGCDLTTENENIVSGILSELSQTLKDKKAEFILGLV